MKLNDLKILILCLLFQLQVANTAFYKQSVSQDECGIFKGVCAFHVSLGIQFCIPMTQLFSPNFVLWNEVAYSQTHVMMTTVETFSM